MWILLVSANPALLNRTRDRLAALGHHVIGAHGTADAIAYLHLHRFDLVASDPDAAEHPWAASLRNRWDTFDVPFAVFRDPADLAAPLRLASRKDSPRSSEKSARRWAESRDVRMACRLLSVFRATRR